MAKCFIDDSTLTSIGNAIRAKTGGTDLMLPSAMPAAIEGIISGGAGQYVWSRKGATESVTEDTAGGTYTLTTPNDSRPSSTIYYSYDPPTYDSSSKRWGFSSGGMMTVTNADDEIPSFDQDVYIMLDSDWSNVWYLVTSFAKGSTSPYLKNMTYSTKYEAAVDNSYVEVVTGNSETEYPNGGWQNGYWYDLLSTEVEFGEVIFTEATTSLTVQHGLEETPSKVIMLIKEGTDVSTVLSGLTSVKSVIGEIIDDKVVTFSQTTKSISSGTGPLVSVKDLTTFEKNETYFSITSPTNFATNVTYLWMAFK